MEELRKNLELVDVTYENNNQKAVMTFLDEERSEIRVVNFNKQSYNGEKYVDDPKKAEKVEEWCEEYFGLDFANLQQAVGTKHDIYEYERFNSLFHVDIVEKFTEDMQGQIFDTTCTEVIVDDTAIRIRYQIDGKTYESKMTFAQYIQSKKAWYPDPQKKVNTFARFEKKFGIPVEQAEQLVGQRLLVECKKAFNSFYGDIKAFPKTK